MGHALADHSRTSLTRLVGRRLHALAIVAVLCLMAGLSWAQAPAAPLTPAAPAEGVTGEAPIAAGNVAAARDRALNEAFRQLVEAGFAGLLAENALAAPTPALVTLRSSWLARPKRLVRNYRVLAESEQNGILQVRISAELDEAHMRREFDRARGVANRGLPPGVTPLVSSGAPEAATALRAALTGEGVRVDLQPGAPPDEAGMRALAQRSGRGTVVAVSGRAAAEGPVRGAGLQAVDCHLAVRLVSASGGADSPERAAGGRGFATSEADARTACFAKAIRQILPALLPDLGTAAAAPGDLRVVMLDLDLTEPAVLSPLLRALRKVAGPTAAELRRVVVGRVEIRVSSRLTPAALWNALGRELASQATLTRLGADRGDRLTAQIRMLPATLPPASAPTPPSAPGASLPP
jgi:hypothetical protein